MLFVKGKDLTQLSQLARSCPFPYRLLQGEGHYLLEAWGVDEPFIQEAMELPAASAWSFTLLEERCGKSQG